MTNKLTTAAVLARIEDVVPNRKVHLTYHDVSEAEASRIVRVFPKSVQISTGYTAGETIRIAVNESLQVTLFLKATYRPIVPPTNTPVANRILAEAGL